MTAVVNKDNCVGCGLCVDACPNSAIKMVDETAVVDPDVCIDCEACVGECPNGAISMK
jgi:Fe-S-cluster-containing hydrogenase component 2